MKRIFYVVCALVATIWLSPGAGAQDDSLSARMAARNPVHDVTVEVGCGKTDKENCAVVVPEVNTRIVARHVRLKALKSAGSVESTDALCANVINAAVVQADVFATRNDPTLSTVRDDTKPDCTGRLAVLGKAMYPYLGFMIVAAGRTETSFDDMIKSLPDNKVLNIAAGGPGSGGEYTLRVVLDKNPEWRRHVNIMPDGQDSALAKIKDGGLDAFFNMDGPQSPLLKSVREDTDKDGKPNYKFVDFRPNDALLQMHYGRSRLYAEATIAKGWIRDVRTIATPAIFILTNDWYQQNGPTASIIRQGILDSAPSIAAKTGAASDWTTAFGAK